MTATSQTVYLVDRLSHEYRDSSHSEARLTQFCIDEWRKLSARDRALFDDLHDFSGALCYGVYRDMGETL